MTLDLVNKCASAPPTLKNVKPILEKFGYSKVICTGIDLTKGSMNLYFFMHEGGVKDEATLISLFDDLNLKCPSKDILKYITGSGNSGSFAITLGWN